MPKLAVRALNTIEAGGDAPAFDNVLFERPIFDASSWGAENSTGDWFTPWSSCSPLIQAAPYVAPVHAMCGSSPASVTVTSCCGPGIPFAVTFIANTSPANDNTKLPTCANTTANSLSSGL